MPYVAAGVMLVIATVFGLYSIVAMRSNSRQNEELAKVVKERQAEIAQLKGEGEKVQQLLTPDQKVQLTAAHKLVANKTFGWSRLFSDLERVLPSGVAASRIQIGNIYQDAESLKAELELGVLSKDHGSVMAMLENMNNSGQFKAELRGQDLNQNERITYTEFTFRVIYSPSYGYAAPGAEVAMNQGGVQ